jgi:inner membrane protein
MPTVLSHPAVPLAIGFGLSQYVVPRRLLIAGVVASVVPDLDVIGLHLGIHYPSVFGHRGITHSLLFAVAMGFLLALGYTWFETTRRRAFAFIFASTASHGLLDMMTNGGSGIALWWPLSSERFKLPWRVIEVSPLNIEPFLDSAGIILRSELFWVWLPSVVFGCVLYWSRMHLARR